jgi:hypothetical protein
MDESMQGIPPNWGLYFHVEANPHFVAYRLKELLAP